MIAGGEQGLLSMAFAPDYAKTRRFYVNYTDRAGVQRVVEYRRSKSSPDARRRRAARGSSCATTASSPTTTAACVAFGPDGLLYIGTGDGGGADDQHGARGNAQDLGKLLGKLLRIDPRALRRPAVPRPVEQPVRRAAPARAPEIYSYGLRNPWRFSFDRTTGDLTIGDVGQNEIEEIDFAREGRGARRELRLAPVRGHAAATSDEHAPGAVAPVLELTHDDGNCSVTGGYVVRDPALPALAGRYVYGDFCKGQLRSARLSAGLGERRPRSLGLQDGRRSSSSFGEDGARPRLRRLARRPGLPARRRLTCDRSGGRRMRSSASTSRSSAPTTPARSR